MTLTLYSATYERLPCPASPLEARLSAPSRNNTTADPCAADVQKPPDGVVAYNSDPGTTDDPSSQVWIGVIPTQALRLDSDQGTDGWGNFFTYAVSRGLTLPQGMRGNPLPSGIISVVDENGRNVLDKPNTGRYVIVSHGPSGAGAWNAQGSRKACEPDTADFKNCNGGGVFVIAPFSKKPGPTFYDDVVIHDDTNAGGSLLDRIAVCTVQRAFYVPSSPDADQDGCSHQINLWQGACQVQLVTSRYGVPLPSVPYAIMPPAIASGTGCSCAPGYTVVTVGTWYDSSPLLPAGTYSGKEHTQTALYTCTR